jgi:hypothetical protein
MGQAADTWPRARRADDNSSYRAISSWKLYGSMSMSRTQPYALMHMLAHFLQRDGVVNDASLDDIDGL